ncbi:hypothetical protein EGW08_008137, partial [Elysia chlorotica]
EPSPLQKSLTCFLCGEIFRRPRVMPCGHTFCTDCLVKLKDEVLGVACSHPSNPGAEPDSFSSDRLRPSPGGHNIRSSTSPSFAQESYSERDQNSPYLGLTYGLREWDPSPEYSSDVDGFAGAVDLDRTRSTHSCTNGCGHHNDDKINSGNGVSNGSRLSRSQTFTYESNNPVVTEAQLRHPSTKDSTTGGQALNRLSAPHTLNSGRKSPQTCSQCGSVTRSVSPTTLPRRSSRKQAAKAASLSPRPASPPEGPPTPSLPRWNSSSQSHSSSPYGSSSSVSDASPGSFEHRHGREMEAVFCPVPECGYSLRLMNLARWSPRNRALGEVISAWRQQQVSTRSSSTQTEVSTERSLLVTIPRSLVDSRALQPLGLPQGRRRHSSMVDMAIDSAISMDSLERGYLPRGHSSWRSYAAMLGMNILQQIVNL